MKHEVVEYKVYGWGGRKMPVLHLNDPEYCEYGVNPDQPIPELTH